MSSPQITNDVFWDLSDLYSGTDDPQVEVILNRALAAAVEFETKYKGQINNSNLTAEVLGRAIREYEAIEQDVSKPGNFAHLLFSTDTSDPKRGAFLQHIREQSTQIYLPLLFFSIELAAAPASLIDPLLSHELIKDYKHYVIDVRLQNPHMLSEIEERLLEETANTGSRAFVRLFSETTSNTVFHLDGKDVTQSEVLATLYSPDREARKAGAAAFSAGLQTTAKTLAFIFNTLMQDKNVSDRLRHYDYPEQSRHLSNELSKSTVDLVVDTVARNYPIVARYYRLKRDILGGEELTHFDRYAPLFEADETIDFAEAKNIILDAFGAFSSEMRVRADEFFEKNWIDAAPGKGKEGGAYCMYVTPDLHPYVFMNYLGRMKDVMTLAHELGHGVHSSLSREQSLLNFHGTLPLAELASTFGEMLVFEKIQNTASLKDKLAMYAEKIEGAFATIPRQTALYRFEQAIHKHRRDKGELTLDDFGGYWQSEIQSMFGDCVMLGDEHKLWWSYIGHFIRSPFYVYAYSFGELLVMALYRRAQSEGDAFATKYLDMLRAGGSLTPQELVAKVDVDLDDAAFWQGGFDVLEDLVVRFENMWAEYQTKASGD